MLLPVIMPRKQCFCRSVHRSAECGFALVSVLWVLALLALFSAGVIALVRSDTLVARSLAKEAQAEGWADAAVYYVLNSLIEDRIPAGLSFDGRTGVVQIAAQAVTVSVQDEAGKIDLNYADPEILKNLFVKAGKQESDAEKMAFVLEKRRDAVMKAVSANALKKIPFRTIEEIKSLPGVDEQLYQRIYPAVTVYSQSSTPYTVTAPRLVLESMPNADPVSVESILSRRQNISSAAVKDRTYRLGNADRKSTYSGKTFTIQATAVVGSSIFSRVVVVRVTDDNKKPFWILNWTTGDLQTPDERIRNAQ